MKIAQRKLYATAPWGDWILYHCSPAVYEKPCMVEAEKHVRAADKHPNGVLGLWLSNVPESCIGFGTNVYETEISPQARIGEVHYAELFGWHHHLSRYENQHIDQVEWYKAKRLELLRELDVIYVEDNRPKGSSLLGEIIVVNLDVITKHERTELWRTNKRRVAV